MFANIWHSQTDKPHNQRVKIKPLEKVQNGMLFFAFHVVSFRCLFNVIPVFCPNKSKVTLNRPSLTDITPPSFHHVTWIGFV